MMYELSLSTGLTTEISTVDRLAGVLHDHLQAGAEDAVHWSIRTPAGQVHSGHIAASSSQDWITVTIAEITANLNREAAGPSDQGIARIHLSIDLDVDVQAWATEYGLSLSDVPDDARRLLTAQLHEDITATAARLGTFTPANITAVARR